MAGVELMTRRKPFLPVKNTGFDYIRKWGAPQQGKSKKLRKSRQYRLFRH
jgi:hypothetical protein